MSLGGSSCCLQWLFMMSLFGIQNGGRLVPESMATLFLSARVMSRKPSKLLRSCISPSAAVVERIQVKHISCSGCAQAFLLLKVRTHTTLKSSWLDLPKWNKSLLTSCRSWCDVAILHLSCHRCRMLQKVSKRVLSCNLSIQAAYCQGRQVETRIGSFQLWCRGAWAE